MNKFKKIIACILVTIVFIVGCSSNKISEKEAIELVNKLVDTNGHEVVCTYTDDKNYTIEEYTLKLDEEGYYDMEIHAQYEVDINNGKVVRIDGKTGERENLN